MSKCVYCNSTDLTVSDIISYALTGAKLTSKFVCKDHNAFTNDNFEKAAIAHLDFFRNSLGLTTRSGEKIKFQGNIIFDDIETGLVSISDRASIYENSKRLFTAEKDGKKQFVGPISLLKKKKGVVEENIVPVNVSNTTIRVAFSPEELLASKEMLLTIAKIAYEWFCYKNNIQEFVPEEYGEIVDTILMRRPVEQFVEICNDESFESIFSQICQFGSHALFTYTDSDGWLYVIYDFWGVAIYKIKIRKAHPADVVCFPSQYDVSIYNLDGEITAANILRLGIIHIPSGSAADTINKRASFYAGKLEALVKTTTLTYRKVKELVNALKSDLRKYQKTNEFEQLVAYEDQNRATILRILQKIEEYAPGYDFKKSFNENMRSVLNCEEVLSIDVDENKDYLKSLVEYHSNGTLAQITQKRIAIFDSISSKIDGDALD